MRLGRSDMRDYSIGVFLIALVVVIWHYVVNPYLRRRWALAKINALVEKIDEYLLRMNNSGGE